MPINKHDFKNALREIVGSEFADIPNDEEEIPFTPSPRFRRKMEKLIRSQKKAYWNFVNTAAKRVAVVFLAVFTACSAALSVKAIREPVVEFIIEVYEIFTHFAFSGDTVDVITSEYALHYVPEGFSVTSRIQSEQSVLIDYSNVAKATIQFSQMPSGAVEYYVDNENDRKFENLSVNGCEVKLYEAYDVKEAIWLQDGYFFTITTYGDISQEEIVKMIESVRSVESAD